jgi:G:T-mismatch repair DNA endonuclease (very short patch repair protein)
MYQDFFDMAVERHGFAYSYVDTSLRFLSEDIDVVCPTHGPFTVVASDHIHGRGCPKCRPNGSVPENELADFIHGLGFDIVRNTRKVIPPLELDIVLPKEKIAFEFNGIFWHSEQAGKSVEYHQNKTSKSRTAGYRLFHVYESDWDLNKDVMMGKIGRILSQKACPDISASYPIEEYTGDHHLILKGQPIAGFRAKDGIAKDSWSLYGLEPIKKLMVSSGIHKIQSRLDWPEFTLGQFSSHGFYRYMNVNPGRLYFDRKTLRRLKEKPQQCQGLEYFSVVDSGSIIWEVRVEHDVPHHATD